VCAAIRSTPIALTLGVAALNRNPVRDQLIEHAKRDFAAEQHGVMKAAQIEVGPELIAGALA
jgi:hypothetical protein